MVAETVIEQHFDHLTAGERLKEAREQHHMERQDIARWLKLDEKYIQAIEEGDEEHLPGPVFIAGYIRSYAKLVDLPPDQLVKEFTRSHEVASPQITPQTEQVPGRMSKVAESLPKRFSLAAGSRSDNVKWFALISVGLLVVGVVSWVAVIVGDNRSEIATMDTVQDIALAPATPLEPSLRPAPSELKSPKPDQAETKSGAGRADKSPPSAADKVSKGTPSQITSDAQAVAGKDKEVTPKRITVPLPLHKKERSDPGVVSVLGDEQLGSVNSSVENIAVRFSAESWIDIRDATGKRLIRSLGVAGDSKEVQGVAPFQVLIGYGPGVELIYNGEPYDFSKYQGKQEVARFTLDPMGNPTNKQKNNSGQN